ncbi:MAG: hypothetical protein J6I40_08170 [Mailhella sp.]|nr:hypothetical protein [Mailhella sp.]
MSTSITGVTGFDQEIYDKLLVQYTESTGKTKADLDSVLLSKINGNVSFKDAVDQMRSGLPQLAAPRTTMESGLNQYLALPSFGASYLSMITDLAAQQRLQNSQMKAMSTEEMIAKIKEQAKTIRDKAIAQLVTGIVTGSVSIAQGCAVMGMSIKGGRAADSAGETAKNQVLQANGFDVAAEGFNAADVPANIMAQANSAATQAVQTANMNLNNTISCFNSCMSGTNSILGSIGQFIATQYDAKLKEQEGDVERIRATQQMLDSLDESLKTVIQKSLSTQDALQQNINQTRTKILG